MIDWPSFWIGVGCAWCALVLGPIAILYLIARHDRKKERRG